jgi:trehalose/maltose hydrolase-like predicted phosphorylase
VTGPDEYSAVVDNNVYTNLMAERRGVTAEEVRAWQEAAKKVVIPHDDVLDGHPQSERFTEHAEWNFAATPPERYPLLLHHPYPHRPAGPAPQRAQRPAHRVAGRILYRRGGRVRRHARPRRHAHVRPGDA